jgi:CBS domain-containing protein
MNNTIAIRVYDFLKNYPPFTLVEKGRLMNVAEKIVIQYYEPQQYIFEQDSAISDYFYVVKEGAVQLLRNEEDQKILIDECDNGDVFGIRPLLAKRPYVVSAQAMEETLIYAIHTDDFQDIFKNNSEVAFYLASNFAAGVRNRFAENKKGRFYYGAEKEISSNYKLVEVQSIESSKTPVTCLPNTLIRDAAKIMSKNGVGSIIVVNEKFHPLGITTDRDFRQEVVAGSVSPTQAVSEIMSSPVITIPPDRTVAEVQIEMLQHRIHHLCITEDGTIHSKILGIISEHDLLVVQANNPAVLIREIKKGTSGATLRKIRDKAEVLLQKYLEQEVSIKYISEIMSEINDALIIRAIQIAENDLEVAGYEKPVADFCWLALGSEGRKEQLLRTDQDNALVFENVSEEDYDEVKGYYLALAENVTLIIHECGFEYCPADMMASNPQWCMSLEKWEQRFSKWMNQPGTKEVMMTTIFFDYRPIHGNFQLAEEMTQHIFEGIDQQEIYLSHLANNALQNPPPLSFFRNFIVEKNGEHKDQFDLKARAMMPLADAARVLILNAKVGQINNTFERFEKLAELEEGNRELFEQAADAYEILMRFRATQGLKHNDSGRFVKPSELNKMQRLMLRNSFQPIHDLQSLLKVRFRLNLFG